ncbi:MAG: hypothetical protein ACMXYM_01590 [Candidatus Woesearchaeota archaeon]
MGKIEAADHRMFSGVFVCKSCKSKIRSTMMKVLRGKVSCRKCSGKALRVKRKK